MAGAREREKGIGTVSRMSESPEASEAVMNLDQILVRILEKNF